MVEALVDARNRDATIDAIIGAQGAAPPEPVAVTKARRKIENAQLELDRVLAALRAAVDPELAASTTRTIQAERDKAQTRVDTWEAERGCAAVLTREDVEDALNHAGGIAPMLADADRATRAELYRNLGLELTYNEPDGDPSVTVRYQLRGGGGRI